MIKFFKSNKIISIFLIIICIIIIFNPTLCLKSCLNGISVWALKVMPLMFPFFVLTKSIAYLNPPKKNFMDKFFQKAYHTPNGSFLTYVLSLLSGYPMGAKLICDLYRNKHVSSSQAKSMLSFCSVSGPMFMIGTVGVSMFLSFKAGLVIFISNIIASLLNGLFFKNKDSFVECKNFTIKQTFNFSDCVYDSLISILMVGSYIVLSFILIDLLENLNLFNTISKLISSDIIVNNIFKSVMKSILEITRGIYDLSQVNCSILIKTIVASGAVGFGGLSVFLQSFGFLEKLKISPKIMIKQKITQGLLATIISIPFALLFL